MYHFSHGESSSRVIGITNARKNLEQRKLRISGKDPEMYNRLSKIIQESIEMNFANEGRPKWKKRVKEKEYTYPILNDTGTLKNTTLRSAGGNKWMHWVYIHALRIRSVSYGWFHQYGAPRKRLPARPYVKIQDTENRQILETIKEALR